jgi:hypothetical protein
MNIHQPGLDMTLLVDNLFPKHGHLVSSLVCNLCTLSDLRFAYMQIKLG